MALVTAIADRQGLPEHIEGVAALDARRVIVWSAKGDVQRWNVGSGELDLTLDSNGAKVIGVGGDGLVVRKREGGVLGLLDPRASSIVCRTRRAIADAMSAGFSRSQGRFCVCGAAVYVFDATSCELLALHQHDRLTDEVHAV